MEKFFQKKSTKRPKEWKLNQSEEKEKRRKMLSIVKSMSLNGLDGYLVSVQVDVSAGIPGWEIVRSS